MADTSPIDPQALRMLERVGGGAFVSQMARIFLSHLDTRLLDVRRAVEAGRQDEAGRGAHAIKSSAGQIGAVRVRRAAERIEEAAAAPRPADLPELFDELEAAYREAADALREIASPPKAKRPPSIPSIAVVEDNPDNRLLLQAILSDHYRVIEYEDAASALAAFEVGKPDLVLLDISLPGMDGSEALRRIRETAAFRDLPVIALTAHAMAGDREKYLSEGFDDYLTKPIMDENLLLQAVTRALERQNG